MEREKQMVDQICDQDLADIEYGSGVGFCEHRYCTIGFSKSKEFLNILNNYQLRTEGIRNENR
jgi:hypothetical protein